MAETILVGIISAASALLGVLITQRYELRKRESEERRWYADYFLGRKIDALNNRDFPTFYGMVNKSGLGRAKKGSNNLFHP